MRATPMKSSLRRSESHTDIMPGSGLLGSHPLRRQSSVSWAEELERVKILNVESKVKRRQGRPSWKLRGLGGCLGLRLGIHLGGREVFFC
jgi:hypothetical protein